VTGLQVWPDHAEPATAKARVPGSLEMLTCAPSAAAGGTTRACDQSAQLHHRLCNEPCVTRTRDNLLKSKAC
jgi:hypothetical protein